MRNFLLKGFEEFSGINAFVELTELLGRSEVPAFRKRAAGFGMLYSAIQAVNDDNSIEGVRRIVRALQAAKDTIDVSSKNDPGVIGETSRILSSVEDFMDENTISANEWPLREELIEFISENVGG